MDKLRLELVDLEFGPRIDRMPNLQVMRAKVQGGHILVFREYPNSGIAAVFVPEKDELASEPGY